MSSDTELHVIVTETETSNFRLMKMLNICFETNVVDTTQLPYFSK